MVIIHQYCLQYDKNRNNNYNQSMGSSLYIGNIKKYSFINPFLMKLVISKSVNALMSIIILYKLL